MWGAQESWLKEGKGERRWPRERSRLEGGARALESGWKERREERKWKIEHCGGPYGVLVLGLSQRWPPPCWAEEELEGTQDRDGRWWETEWRGPGRVRQVRARRRVTAERRVGRSLPAMVEPHLHSP